jgi:hypothetical protein
MTTFAERPTIAAPRQGVPEDFSRKPICKDHHLD